MIAATVPGADDPVTFGWVLGAVLLIWALVALVALVAWLVIRHSAGDEISPASHAHPIDPRCHRSQEGDSR